MSPQDPIATELLEKALRENAEKDAVFTTAVVNDHGDIMSQDSEDVEQLIKHHQHTTAAARRNRANAGHPSRQQRHANEEGRAPPPGMNRRRLGDVTREFGGMDVSDDEGL